MGRHPARLHGLARWLLLGATSATACGPAASVPSTSPEIAASSARWAATTSPSPSPALEPDLESLVSGSRVVRFPASDGVRLGGRLFPGRGPVGLVLSHMGRGGDDQSDWYPAAARLAELGHTVLTYDRRGVCPGGLRGCSGGHDDFSEHWRDVLGAIAFLHRRGVDEVFVAGASIGAMASFRAVQDPAHGAAGVIWVAGLDFGSGYRFTKPDVSRVEIPKIFVSSEGDLYNAAEAARIMFGYAVRPKRLLILPGDEHGTDMLLPGAEGGRELIDAILAFLRDHAEHGSG